MKAYCEFDRAAEELRRETAPPSESGSLQYPEKKVRDFLKDFDDFTSDPRYRYFASTLYHNLWRPRLRKYRHLLEALGDGRSATRASVLAAIKTYKDLLELTAEIPVWTDVINKDWMCRHRSSLAAFEGELRRSQRTPEAVCGFERAATELENIPEPSPLDRAIPKHKFLSCRLSVLGTERYNESGKGISGFLLRHEACSTATVDMQRE
jgi:hypothetical protein